MPFKEKIYKRVDQLKELINQIKHDDFLCNEMPFGNQCKLDMEKLVAAGHSMGGGTALKLAQADNRVKLVLTLDPWLYPIQDDI